MLTASFTAGATPACKPIRLVVINLYGDSTQEGLVVSRADPHGTQAATHPGQALQAAMDTRFGAGAVRVNNRGIGGTTSTDFLASGVKPEGHISVANFGINDSQRMSIEQFKANLRAIPVSFYETPIIPNELVWFNRPKSFLSYVQAVRDVAREKRRPVIDTSDFVQSIPDWRRLMSDGVHPGARLYEMIGREALFEALEPAVAKLRCQQSAIASR